MSLLELFIITKEKWRLYICGVGEEFNKYRTTAENVNNSYVLTRKVYKYIIIKNYVETMGVMFLWLHKNCISMCTLVSMLHILKSTRKMSRV